MGAEYELVNQTKKEVVSFLYLNGSKKRELVGNPVQSAIVTWYLLNNQGDDIQFVSDINGEWPFSTGSRKVSLQYPDKTEEIIDTLIREGVLKDNGILCRDKEEPDMFYIRDIVNVWK